MPLHGDPRTVPPLPEHVQLIRHAETVWNRDQIGFGHTDIPLSPEGVQAAHEFVLPDGITRIFTSPLSRATETAAIIAHTHNLPTPTVAVSV